MTEYDAIVIGTGQAGPALAHRLTGAGMRVAIVERHRFGGTCVNTGCTPTKTLVASAYAAHLARRAAEFGVIGRRSGDRRHEEGQGAQGRRVRALRQGGRALAEEQRQAARSIRATPASIAARRCAVGGDVLDRRAHLHQRRRPRCRAADMPGLDQVDYLTNSTMLEVDFVPRASRHHRRKLHRPGVRADVPPLRQPRDGRRDGAAPDPAGGRGRLRGDRARS